MNIEIETHAYNEKRWGKPYIAVIDFSQDPQGTPRWGTWIGQPGQEGILKIEADPGDVIIQGQKDHRRNKARPRCGILQPDGTILDCSKAEAYRIWKARNSNKTSVQKTVESTGRKVHIFVHSRSQDPDNPDGFSAVVISEDGEKHLQIPKIDASDLNEAADEAYRRFETETSQASPDHTVFVAKCNGQYYIRRMLGDKLYGHYEQTGESFSTYQEAHEAASRMPGYAHVDQELVEATEVRSRKKTS